MDPVVSTLFNVARLPRRPYCSNNKTASLILPIEDALQYAYIQPNPPGLIFWFVFDIDREDAADRFKAVGGPTPNIVSLNSVNGHAQYFYAMAAVVNTGKNGREHPKEYAEAVYRSLAEFLGADPAYSRLIAKNPLHPSHRSAVLRTEPYSLGELAKYLDLNNSWKLARRHAGRKVNEKGRNSSLFDTLRAWAYEWVREYKSNGASYDVWREACLQQAETSNDFPGMGALPASEVKALAKSVAKWCWTKYNGTDSTDSDFRQLQTDRGKRKGATKRVEWMAQAHALVAAGKTQREVAAIIGVSQKTVCNWLRSDVATERAPANASTPRSTLPVALPPPVPPLPTPLTPAEEKAWKYFDHVLPGQKMFWWEVWNDSQFPHRRRYVPWSFPPALLAEPDERDVNGTMVPHIEMMMRRAEANARACGRTLPW